MKRKRQIKIKPEPSHKKYLPFVASLLLHLSVLLAVGFLSGGGNGGGSGDGNQEENKDGQIIPKVVEITIVEPQRSEEGEIPAPEPLKVKPTEGIKECEGEHWFGGIGVMWKDIFDSRGSIAKVVPGYPASKAGIQDGDSITAVNGETKFRLGAIRGEVGSSVKITVYRPSTGQTRDYTLIREKICTEDKK